MIQVKIKDFEIRDRGLFVWQFKTADSIDNPDSIEDSPLRCSQQHAHSSKQQSIDYIERERDQQCATAVVYEKVGGRIL